MTGDYLLLKERNRCPSCYQESVPNSLPARCRECGKPLFKDTDAIKRYEEDTGWREYWVWTNDLGWMHRTQVFDTQAQKRVQEVKELEEGYGTEEFTTRRLNNSRYELKEELELRKKHKGRLIFTP